MNTIAASEFMALVHNGKLEADSSVGADDAVLLSCAISLKRIADALESTANIEATRAAYEPGRHSPPIDPFDDMPF